MQKTFLHTKISEWYIKVWIIEDCILLNSITRRILFEGLVVIDRWLDITYILHVIVETVTAETKRLLATKILTTILNKYKF